MRPVTPEAIRTSMINMSDTELSVMTLPGLHETLWEEREFFGVERRAPRHERICRVLGGRKHSRLNGARSQEPHAPRTERDLRSLSHSATRAPGKSVCCPKIGRRGNPRRHGGHLHLRGFSLLYPHQDYSGSINGASQTRPDSETQSCRNARSSRELLETCAIS